MSKHTKKKAEWLKEVASKKQGTYSHRLFKDQPEHKDESVKDLQTMVKEAHKDALTHFNTLVYSNLDPLAEPSPHPKIAYPNGLHFNTLKGYFGEIIAAYLILEKAPFATNGWKVPVFRFRFHNVAFEQLILATQTNGETKKVPGLTGEDCVGFLINDKWELVNFIIAEAKCTADHSSAMVKEAHSHVSKHDIAPTVIPQIIEIIQSQNNADADKWIQLLRGIFLAPDNFVDKRLNLVVYTCGRTPQMGTSWISDSAPHADYSSKKPLEAAEVHVNDVDHLIKKAYGLE